MNPESLISWMDLIGVLACVTAASFIVYGWKRTRLTSAIPILLLGLLVLMGFYCIAMFLEWSEKTTELEWLEDISGVFIPFTWAFIFYAIIKSATEEKIRAERRHFCELVESTSDWIWEIDAAGYFTYVSPRIRDILGYTPEEIVGTKPFDLMPPKEAERLSALFFEGVKNRASFQDLKNINLHKDGHEVILETNAVPVFDKRDRLTGYRGIDRDITDREEIERRTAQQQAELNSIFTASPAGIGLVRNRKLIRGNHRFFEITGYLQEELIGRDPRDFYPTEADYQTVGEKYHEALAKGSVQIETRWIRKDRTMIDVVLYLAPLDRDDPDNGFVVVMQDITALKAAGEQAMAEKTRAQLYLDVAGVIIVVLDPSGKVMLLNKKGCELLGCSAEQALGVDWVQTFSPVSYREIARNAFQRIIGGHEDSVAYFESPVLSRSGVEKLIAWHNSVLRDESGRIVGVISSGEDVTETRAAETAWRKSEERLRVALSAAQMGTWRWVAGTNQYTRDASLNALLGLVAKETTQDVSDFFNYVHPDDRAAAREEFDRAIRERGTYLARFRIIRADGQVRWVLDQGKPFYDFNGKLDYVTGVVVDMTERQEAEQRLQQSEAALRRAQRVGKMGSYEFDIKSEIITASDELRESVGFAPDEKITLEKVLDRVAPEDRSLFRQAIERSMVEDKVSVDYRMVTPEGSIRWFRNYGERTLDEQGHAVTLYGTAQDITEQKLAEQQLRDSEAQLRKAQQIARLGFYDWDLQNDVVTASENFKTFFGCKPDEDLTFDFMVSRIHPDDRERFVSADLESRTHGTPFSMDYRVLLPDGRIRWAHDQSEITEDEQGNKVRMFGTLQDITERKEAERERETLMQQLQFTQFAVDHAEEIAYWVDSDGKFVYVNEAACRAMGYTREEMLTKYTYEMSAEFTKEMWHKRWEVFREQKTTRFETRHKRKDGSLVPVEVDAVYVEYGGKEYSCAFVRDITERKIAEQEREVLMQQLRNRNDELQSIVFTTAHDLRSPLVNIEGFAGELEKGVRKLQKALAKEKLSEKAAEEISYLVETDIPQSLKFVRAGGQHMDRLLNGLMRLSLVGAAPIRVSAVDMSDVFDNIVEGLQYQINENEVEVTIQPGLPDCMGDFSMLTQVFGNLLDNAIKYRHPKRKATIEVQGVTKGDVVEYTVTDNGIGVAPDHLEKVFELFHRLNTKQGSEGQGLGLTIVRRILDRLGGTVRIDSVSGAGTTVYVRLPRVE